MYYIILYYYRLVPNKKIYIHIYIYLFIFNSTIRLTNVKLKRENVENWIFLKKKRTKMWKSQGAPPSLSLCKRSWLKSNTVFVKGVQFLVQGPVDSGQLYLRSLPLKGTTWIPSGPPSFDTSTSLTMSLGDGETGEGGGGFWGGGGERRRVTPCGEKTKRGHEMVMTTTKVKFKKRNQSRHWRRLTTRQ